MNQFVKVFDVLDSGYRDWTFPAFGLIFVAIGIALLAFPKIIKRLGIPNAPYLNGRSAFQAFFPYIFVGLALLWTVIVFIATYSHHLRHKALVQENQCRIVEGPVEHFVTGEKGESFSVAGVDFKYSDYVITDGFNNTSSHDGPINSSSYVRICYDPKDYAILRLEIRDFKGEVKDYSKVDNIFSFPSSSELQNEIVRMNVNLRTSNIPWYGHLFIVLYALDFLGIYLLLIPYLKTFFRFETAAVPDSSISRAINERTKTKLRNSLIYWDTNDQTIWLRPRGFNLIKIPLMVAALKVDAARRAIATTEIRFSSGFPFVAIVFFWTVYRSFSAMPGPPPALFIGMGASIFVIGGFFTLRRYRAGMETLLEEALTELHADT